jgi:hypothetical protein
MQREFRRAADPSIAGSGDSRYRQDPAAVATLDSGISIYLFPRCTQPPLAKIQALATAQRPPRRGEFVAVRA